MTIVAAVAAGLLSVLLFPLAAVTLLRHAETAAIAAPQAATGTPS